MIETASANLTDTLGLDEQPVLEVRNLSKRFPVGSLFQNHFVHALSDASFVLPRGKVIALVGESGSGKSTTVRLIARLMPPTSGKIFFKGVDVLATEPKGASLSYRNKVQMIFQDPFGSLNGVHTIGHHLERPLRIHKKVKSRGEMRDRIHELLTTVGLNPATEFANKFPHQLSGGQRQRVAIARALAVDPEVILADEPISMLDVSIRMGVLNLMEQMKEERGIAYVYITHDIASARYIGDSTMVMYAGHMVEGAESKLLMEQPAHPYTKLLLSAVPNPHAGLSKRKLEARGEVPSLIDPPPGCPFVNRCPKVMDICRQQMPGIELVERDHWVRCHLYGPGQQQPAV
jgi:peptide/nickel transport system ATP-binding protein